MQQYPQALGLHAEALNTGTFSQAGTWDRDTVISSKDAAPALIPTGDELTLPTPDISCLSVGIEAEIVVANSYFLKIAL